APLLSLVEEFEEKPVGAGPLPGRRIVRVFGSHDGRITLGIRTKKSIDVVIGASVVFVHRHCVEHRVEIDCVHSQVGEVVEPVDYTLQVSTIATCRCGSIELVGHSLLPRLQRIPIGGPWCDGPTLWSIDSVASRVVRWIAVCE